jgi:hypothetical protein
MNMTKQRITAQVLNGSTGEVREVVANVPAENEQDAVNTLFTRARKDDYYYRFIGHSGVIEPSMQQKQPIHYACNTYWALE